MGLSTLAILYGSRLCQDAFRLKLHLQLIVFTACAIIIALTDWLTDWLARFSGSPAIFIKGYYVAGYTRKANLLHKQTILPVSLESALKPTRICFGSVWIKQARQREYANHAKQQVRGSNGRGWGTNTTPQRPRTIPQEPSDYVHIP